MSSRTGRGNQPLLIAVAALMLAAAAAILALYFRGNGGGHAPKSIWFYDVGRKDVFSTGLDQLPPIDAPSGAKTPDGAPGGVRAHVYSCGDCGSGRFTGYVERYTPEVKAKRIEASQKYGSRPEALSPAALRQAGLQEHEGHLVASPDAPEQWLAADSPEGQAIIGAYAVKCGPGKTASECWPQ